LVEFFSILFWVKHPRLKVFLYLLPLIKLLLDPFLYDFHNWALLHHMNPFLAPEGSRLLTAMISWSDKIPTFFRMTVGLGLKDLEKTFSPADLLALCLSAKMLKVIVLLFGSLSFLLVGNFLYKLLKSFRWISQIRKKSIPCLRRVKNPLLCKKLRKTHIKIVLSEEVKIPCAIGFFQRSISFPKNFVDQLSQEEFEAILVHELDHLRWRDGILHLIGEFSSVFFWWIPSRWLLHRMEFAQERACDRKIEKFQIAKEDLCSAILKTTKWVKGFSTPIPLLSTCFVQQNKMVKRLDVILKKPICRKGIIFWVQIVFLSVIGIAIFLGKFWIF